MSRFVFSGESADYQQRREELLDGAVYHRYTTGAELDEHNNRGIDLCTPVWNLFDLLPQGRGDWYPSQSYM